jgi:hypothetical protein
MGISALNHLLRAFGIRLSAPDLPGLTRKNLERDGAAVRGYIIAERSDRRQVSGAFAVLLVDVRLV